MNLTELEVFDTTLPKLSVRLDTVVSQTEGNDRIRIVWNGSGKTVRTVRDRMPLLRRAECVAVASLAHAQTGPR